MKTGRPSKSLEDRILGPYKIIKRIGTSYRLELPLSMKRSKGFYISKLRPLASDPLPSQKLPPSNPVIIEDENEFVVDDILSLRRELRTRRL